MANLNNVTTYLSTFGGSPSASAVQNTAACQEAVAVCAASGGGVIFIDNPGMYNIDVSNGIPFDLPNNTILTAGYAATILRATTSGNPLVRMNGQYSALQNVLVYTTINPTSGPLVYYGGNLCSLTNVRILGGFNNLEIASGYELFSTNIHLGGTNSSPGAALLKIHRSGPAARNSSAIFFSNANIQADTAGGYPTGVLIQNCDGCFFNACHAGFVIGSQVLITPEFVNDKICNLHFSGFCIDGNGGGTAGLDFEPLQGFTGVLSLFMLSGGLIEGIGNGPGVLLNDPSASYFTFSGNLVANSATAYQINQGSHISISGGSVSNTKSGVVIGQSATDVVTSGMTAG